MSIRLQNRMDLMQRCPTAFGILLLASGGLRAPSSLRLEPVAQQTKYCLEHNQTVTLRLQVTLKYTNMGETPIVLPRFRHMAGYTLYRNDRMIKRVNRRLSEPMLDTAKLTAAAPDPGLFDVLPPGSTLPSLEIVSIPLGSTKPRGKLRLSGDYDLELRIDHWPGSRGPGLKLARKWESRGVLYMEETASSTIKLRIEERPSPVACPLRID